MGQGGYHRCWKGDSYKLIKAKNMASGYLYGWDPVGEGWVKVVCNPDGELDIDATAIFENPPTEDEASKGPSSEWAFDHNANANAHHTPPVAGDFNHQDLANRSVDDHHAKYTDAEAIAAAAVYENPPTEDEALKAPTSEWAFDHNANVAAHHAKYTDAESRAAIADIFGADGRATQNIDMNYNTLLYLSTILLKTAAGADYIAELGSHATQPLIRLYVLNTSYEYVDFDFLKYNGAAYISIIDQDNFQAEMALYLEEAPTNGVVNKAPTSNWAFDHDADVAAHHVKYTDAEAIAAAAVYENPPTEDESAKAPTSEWAFDHDADISAHHTKYTDAEALAACGLDGDLYWSLPGHGFLTEQADIDNVSRHTDGYLKIDVGAVAVRCPVHLPHTATIDEVIVYGNAGTEDEPWILKRFTVSDQSTTDMATANCNTADTTITGAFVNNYYYNYYIIINHSNTNDLFYGARIKYHI